MTEDAITALKILVEHGMTLVVQLRNATPDADANKASHDLCNMLVPARAALDYGYGADEYRQILERLVACVVSASYALGRLQATPAAPPESAGPEGEGPLPPPEGSGVRSTHWAFRSGRRRFVAS